MRKLTAKDSGDPLYKKVTVKIFRPDAKKYFRSVYRAPAGRGISGDGIDNILKEVADKVEASFPGLDYRLVPIGPTEFNFVPERV